MKHIRKVQSNAVYEEIKNFIPVPHVVLSENEKILHWRTFPKFLYGSDDPDEEMMIDQCDFYTYDGTYYDPELEQKFYKWKKHTNNIFDYNTWILTDTKNLWNASEENPYQVLGAISSTDNGYGDDEYKIRFASEKIDTTILDPFSVQLYNATEGHIPHHNTMTLDTNGHVYVDLGLPSGTLWATMNVGASSITDYGNYYAWGETTPKDWSDPENKVPYDWTTYKYAYGDYNTLTKYCNNSEYGYQGFTDNLIELEMVDDAARYNWGGDWHIPSLGLIAELMAYTNSVWYDDYNESGVAGRLFTSKINGRSMFIPASGNRNGVDEYGVGSRCSLWSSSLNLGHASSACNLYFNDGEVYVGNDNRNDGFTVRPVLY